LNPQILGPMASTLTTKPQRVTIGVVTSFIYE
jgi:hypothetical protein